MMRHIIIYMISILLAAAGTFRANGQETRSIPVNPQMPYYVWIGELPEGVTCTLSGGDGKGFFEQGKNVTVTVGSSKKLKDGFPKYYEGNTESGGGTSLKKDGSNTYTFAMPGYSVTVGVQLASSEAGLKSLKYKNGAGGTLYAIDPLPTPTAPVDVELPWDTSSDAQIYFDATPSDGATVQANPVSLSNGSGDATIVVTAEDGETQKSYNVKFKTQKSITNDMVELTPGNFTYTGNDLVDEVKKALSVKDGNTSLEEGTHYTLSWKKGGESKKPVDAGTYSVVITPTNTPNGYGGDPIEKEFAIDPKNLADSDVAVQEISDQEYEKGGVQPEPEITYNGKTLAKGTDYELSYSDNGSVTNKAKVIIEAKADCNYVGTREETFRITAKKVDVGTEVMYDPDVHDGNIAVNVVSNGKFTVNVADAKLYSLTMEDGAQLDLPKALTLTAGFNASYNVGTGWQTFYNPLDAAAVSVDNHWLATGYNSAEDQQWGNAESVAAKTSYIVAAKAGNQAVRITNEDANVVLDAMTDEPGSPGESLNTGVFLFQGNPTLKNITVQNVYVLKEDGSCFELKESETTIKPFQAYIVANQQTQNLFKSLPLGSGDTPTGLQQLLTGSFRAWGADGRLMLESSEPADVVIYSLSGRLVCRLNSFSGSRQIEMPGGIYFVRTGQMAIKVIL